MKKHRPVHYDPRPARSKFDAHGRRRNLERVLCGRLWWRVTSTGVETAVTCTACLRELERVP